MKNTEITVENISSFSFDTESFTQKAKHIFENLLSFSDVKDYCAVKNYDFKKISFDMVLCSDKEINKINKEYRNIDKPTDVITFAIFADSSENERFITEGNLNLGEIIISLDTIKTQAEDNGNTFEKELFTVTAHGMLHLLGFDHLIEKDYEFVVKNQEKAVQSLFCS